MKKAPAREVEIPEMTMMSLIFKKEHIPVRERHVRNLLQVHNNREKSLKSIGKDLAEAWACREKYRRLADDHEEMLARIRKAVRDGLGLDQDVARLELVVLSGLIRQIKEKAAAFGIEVRSKAIPRLRSPH